MKFNFTLLNKEFTFHIFPDKNEQRWGFGYFINKEPLKWEQPVPMFGLGPLLYASCWPSWNGLKK